MGKLKPLSGPEVTRILERFGFQVHSQRGSHLKLRREIGGMRQTLIVPRHVALDSGTLHGIYRQASRYISPADLQELFFYD